jgi:hypothetical protein
LPYIITSIPFGKPPAHGRGGHDYGKLLGERLCINHASHFDQKNDPYAPSNKVPPKFFLEGKSLVLEEKLFSSLRKCFLLDGKTFSLEGKSFSLQGKSLILEGRTFFWEGKTSTNQVKSGFFPKKTTSLEEKSFPKGIQRPTKVYLRRTS